MQSNIFWGLGSGVWKVILDVKFREAILICYSIIFTTAHCSLFTVHYYFAFCSPSHKASASLRLLPF